MKPILLLLLLGISTLSFAQRDSAPAVPDYGAVYDLSEARQPDKTVTYKVVIDIASGQSKPKYVNDGLFNLARFMNLHLTGGLDPDQMEIVAVLHRDATLTTLDNTGYNQTFKMDNPNLEIIKQLKEAGVEFYVCGQSLMMLNNGLDNINPDVNVALSAMTIITEYQSKGYAMLKFN